MQPTNVTIRIIGRDIKKELRKIKEETEVFFFVAFCCFLFRCLLKVADLLMMILLDEATLVGILIALIATPLKKKTGIRPKELTKTTSGPVFFT